MSEVESKVWCFNDSLKEYIQSLHRDRKLIELYRYIKNGQITNRNEIKSVFGLSEKSITNYLHLLEDIWSVGIVFNQESKKYEIYKDDGKLNLIRAANALTPMQILTILCAVNNSSSFLAEEMNLVKEKLIKQLNKIEEEIVRHCIKADVASGSIKDGQQLENFKIIRQAILKGKIVNITVAENKFKKIEVDPIGFDYQQGRYYLIAYAKTENPYYVNLNNISSVEMINKKHYFDVPHTFVQETILNTWYGADGETVTIRIKIDEQGKQLLQHRRGIVNISPVEMLEDYEIYDITANGLKGIKAWLLGFGEHIEVIEPVELREDFATIAEQLFNKYNDSEMGRE